MNWINAIKELDNVITKWLLIAIIGLMMFLAQGCGMVQGIGQDVQWMGKAGEAAIIRYGESLQE
jgi:predicted small secreted protein